MAAAEAKRLRDALSRVGVMGSELARASFATKHLEQDLARLLAVRVCFFACGACRLLLCSCVPSHAAPRCIHHRHHSHRTAERLDRAAP
jgi:hypothetical protein